MTKQDAKTRTLQCILPGTQTLVFPCCTPLCSAHCPSVHLPNTRVRVHVWKDHILGTAINRVWGDDWIHTIFGGLKYDSLVIDFTTSPKGKGVCEIKWMVAAMVSNLDLANAALNAFYDAFTGKMHQNFTLTDTLEYSRTEKIPGSADDVWSYYGGAFIGAELGASPSIWPTLGGPPASGALAGALDEIPMPEAMLPMGMKAIKTRKVALYVPPGAGPELKFLYEPMLKQDNAGRVFQYALLGANMKHKVWDDDWVYTIFGAKYDAFIVTFTTSGVGNKCECTWHVTASVNDTAKAEMALNAFYDAFTGKMTEHFKSK